MNNYTVDEMKEIVAGVVEQKAKSVLRESGVMKELTNDKNALDVAMDLEVAGDPIDPATGYETFEEWIEHLSKQIRTCERSLANIDVEKVLIIALEYFVENAA